MKTESTINCLGPGWMPEGEASPDRGSAPVKLVPRTRLSPLESQLPEVTELIVGHLPYSSLARLQQASHRMFQVTRNEIRARAAEAAVGVEQLLTIPHPERTVKHMVDIGLLPDDALRYQFSAEKVAVLTSDNILKGLLLNVEKGVGVDIRAFSHIPNDRMPEVWNGVAAIGDGQSPHRISSRENNAHITLDDGSRVTIFSEIVKSRVFANALCDDQFSLFEKCLNHFKHQCDDDGQMLTDAHLALMTQWARVVHPDIHRVQRLALPPGTYEGRMGYIGFSSRFEAALTHLDIVEIMLTQGIDFDIAKADGKTPLICAAMYGHRHMEQVMSVLLEQGVYVDHADARGLTALHWAAKTGIASRVELLLRHGANINHLNAYQRNVLHEAFATRTWEGEETAHLTRGLVRCLLDAGIDLFQKDDARRRPIDYIRWSAGCDEIPQDIVTMVENAMQEQRQARRAERGGCVIA